MCKVYDETIELRRLVKKHGHVIEEVHASASGKVLGTRLVANPAVKQLRAAEDSLMSYMNAFGLTQAARARIGSVVAEAASTATKLKALQAWRNG